MAPAATCATERNGIEVEDSETEYFKTLEETAEYVEEIARLPVDKNKKGIQKALDDYAQLRMDCNDEEIRYSFHELKIMKD